MVTVDSWNICNLSNDSFIIQGPLFVIANMYMYSGWQQAWFQYKRRVSSSSWSFRWVWMTQWRRNFAESYLLPVNFYGYLWDRFHTLSYASFLNWKHYLSSSCITFKHSHSSLKHSTTVLSSVTSSRPILNLTLLSLKGIVKHTIVTSTIFLDLDVFHLLVTIYINQWLRLGMYLGYNQEIGLN